MLRSQWLCLLLWTRGFPSATDPFSKDRSTARRKLRFFKLKSKKRRQKSNDKESGQKAEQRNVESPSQSLICWMLMINLRNVKGTHVECCSIQFTDNYPKRRVQWRRGEGKKRKEKMKQKCVCCWQARSDRGSTMLTPLAKTAGGTRS